MGRIAAIDVGERRIGVAVTDPTGTIAQPLCTISRKNSRQALAELARLIREMKVERVVVGVPLGAEGEPTQRALMAERFGRKLAEKAAVEVVFWNEALTTEDAQGLLRSAGLSGRRLRAKADPVAAAILLRSYLDELESCRGPAPPGAER